MYLWLGRRLESGAASTVARPGSCSIAPGVAVARPSALAAHGRCATDSGRGLDGVERFGGWAVEHVAVEGEAGAVAGAIPCLLGIVELDDASEMGTGGPQGPYGAVSAASNGDGLAVHSAHAPVADGQV